ncbi:MAG: GntR family transcriptional regulator [Eubacteriales bacterium]|nr:GntR family transcriptional regulator [Eubacteriales bacterium]
MLDDLQLEGDVYLPLRDVVFATIRDAIIKGALKPGERLREITLAKKLGVSRTPVREAIRKLELEGLVKMVPRKGAEVAEMSVKNIQDVLVIRRVLEELAVRIACRCINEEQLAKLDEVGREFESLYGKADDLNAAAKADVHFHELIYESTNNPRLIHILSNLREQIYRYRLEYLKVDRAHEVLVEEHRRILEALRERDEEKAAGMIRVHIDNQEESMIQSVTLNMAKNNRLEN